MQIQLSARDLRRAADIKEAIEKAEKELAALLGAPAPAAARAPSSAPAKRSGRPRPHTMTALIREIVQGAGRPLTMDEIMQECGNRGRRIAAGSKARKMFGTILYKTSGVKRVGRGLFALAK